MSHGIEGTLDVTVVCEVPRMSYTNLLILHVKTLKPIDEAGVTSSQRQNQGGPDLLMSLVASSRLRGLLDCEAVPLGVEGP